MCKKLIFLISFVLVLVLAGSASAAAKFDYRACWWSDLGPGHDWNEPNNWWTMDRYWDDVDDDDEIDTPERKFYVKEPNQVPDANTVVFVGKGSPRIDYPEYLHFNPPPFEPAISSGTTEANGVYVGGGYSQDPNGSGWPDLDVEDPDPNLWTPPIYDWDPCLAHELTVNGGTLDIGTPQTWVGYDEQYDSAPYGILQSMGYFNGMDSGSCLRIGTVGWTAGYLGPGLGEGTMHMNGGTVNVGGHMEVGAWEENLGTLNMTDGVINITQGLYCPHTWDGTGRVNLWGGTINARYIFMNDAIRTTGLIDIAGGKFILSRGNEVEELTDYSNGIGTLGYGEVLLTAYGVGDGDIITDDVNYPDANGKRADLSIDYDVSNEGKTTVQTFLTDLNQAWNSSPPNGAGNVKGTVANISRPVLSWSAGDGATSHEVYFGTNEALVSARDVSVIKQTAYSPGSWTVDSDLLSFQTYYWAIDENPGPTLGQVWGFTMANLAKAGSTSPVNGATNVNPTVVLSWASGIYADEHYVYFSADFDDVNNRNPDPAVLTILPLLTQEHDPDLDYETQYYWAVDEVNGLDTWPSEVLTFTTASHLIVDDFDSYVNDEALTTVWLDCWTIDTKAALHIMTEDASKIIDGNSMEFIYDNEVSGSDKRKCSEVEALASDLQAGTDWIVSRTKALTLYFYGQAGNSAQPLYFVVEDGDANEAMVTYDDANGTQEEFWHEWNIDLEDFNSAGVDLTNVYKVYLGVGVRGEIIPTGEPGGGEGYVYFDDFALWPRRCAPSYSFGLGDFTSDCVVDEQDLDIMAGDWLKRDDSFTATAPTDVNLVARWEFEQNYDDSNGSNDGVAYGDLEFDYDSDRESYFLRCDGSAGNYVLIPDSNTPASVFEIRHAITLSAWINLDTVENSWPAIIAKGDDSWRIARDAATGEGIEFACTGLAGGALEPYGNVIGSISVVDGIWHHVAGVYDGSKVCVYVDGIVDNCEDASGLIGSSSYNVTIGSNEQEANAEWAGLIDDLRVYNCALTPGEIAVLAGMQGDIYVPLDVPGNLSPKVGPYGWDPNNRDIVNFLDYGKLAEYWLEEITFPLE